MATKITYQGKEFSSIKKLAQEYGLPYQPLIRKLEQRQSLEKALNIKNYSSVKKEVRPKLVDRIPKVAELFKEGKELTADNIVNLTNINKNSVSGFLSILSARENIKISKQTMSNQKVIYFMKKETV